MPVWLNVAEKPSAAKALATVLSRGQPRTIASLSRFNPVFQFDYEGNTMLVTSVAGHLMETEFPPETKNWATYPFENLFSARIDKHVRRDLEPVQRNLETLAKRSSTLVLWLDCDREGENICFEVVQVAQRQNSRLQIKRAHFSALTERDLIRAVHNLREPDRRLSDAVEARQEMDLRIGAAFTRFQSVNFGSAFNGIPRMLSFGPCQFPTLGFVVERHWERSGFAPEDLFTLHLAHGTTRFHSSRGPMYEQVAATLIFEDMLDAAAEREHKATVVKVLQRPNRRRPPVPLSTVALQKLASTHLHISPERCMTLAEQLYQQSYISYPRTETEAYSLNNEELLDLVQTQRDNPLVGDYARTMAADPQQRFRRPLAGRHDDHAHPPIHPTKLLPQCDGSDERAKLYMLIVRHFLACLSPDAIAATTAVTADFGGEVFTTSGTTILERGYLDVFTYENWHSTGIPNYKEGERFTPSDVNLEKTRTTPPPNLTETDLIALMDDNGIGTDATIAQHIKTILDREYVKKEGQSLVPTKLGIALAAAYESLGLTSLLRPQLRAQMEMAMGDIAAGTATKEQVVEAAVRLYREIFQRLEARTSTFRAELSNYLEASGDGGGGSASGGPLSIPALELKVAKKKFTKCGQCGQPMDLAHTEKSGEDKWERWLLRCTNDACGVQLRVPSGTLNTLEDTGKLCALCSHTALRVTNAEKQTSYTVCPHCFSNPPAPGAVGSPLPDIESAAVGAGATGGADFRCFQCTADCPLAKGLEAIPISTCVSCQRNDLRLRTHANGCYLACKGYPECAFTVSLPKAASVKPSVGQRCPRCNAVLLLFDFSTVQRVPGMDVVEAVCVSCDSRLKDYISVKNYKGVNSSSSSSGVGNNATYSLPSIPATGQRAAPTGGRDNRSGGGGGAAASDVKCGCGVPAKKLVSRKETSKGKSFYTCGAGRKCNFFAWAD